MAVGGVVGFYFYHRITRDMPKIEKLSDYRPKAVTRVFADDGRLIGELYDDERRYPVEFKDIPIRLRQAILSAEDADFYKHPGVDLRSILRAMWVNFRHKSSKQGASTITQQVVKSLLLSREKTYERKAKEAILAYRLEQGLTKDEILSIYLNEIFLGNTAYGVKAAARVHFRKELDQLTLGEMAYIAGLPPKPSELANPRNREEALGRRNYVLQQMLTHGYITAEEKGRAEAEDLKIYPADSRKIFAAPYYVNHVEKLLEEKFGKKYLNPGGFDVYTAASVAANDLATRSLRRGIKEIDKRRGWLGPIASVSMPKKAISDLLDAQAVASKGGIKPDVTYRALVREVKPDRLGVQVGDFAGVVDLKKSAWAQKLLDKNDRGSSINLSSYIKVGMVIEVELDKPKAPEASPESQAAKPSDKNIDRNADANGLDKPYYFTIDQTPELEGGFVCLNHLTGEVKAIVGGYDYDRSVFNRATQGLRQPGSSFKPFVYLAALEHLGYTPTTIVPDSPISLVAGNGQLWTPGNFDGKFLGPITLRTALQRSRNVVSVYMIQKLGVDRVIEAARRLGITTPINRDLSISLGTPEVHLIELTQAYGVFGAGGWLADSLVIKQVKDRTGKLIYEQRPKQKRVVDEDTAFIMANMMKGVVENGTATIVKKLGKPTAGKTGTTNEHMDTWFLGYTPEWAGGVWVGFDVKRTIGKTETGGKAAAPIFLYYMTEFLKDEPALDFTIPDGVIPFAIVPGSGEPADPSAPGAFIEYFKTGTEPHHQAPSADGADTPSADGAVANPAAAEAADEYLQNDEF